VRQAASPQTGTRAKRFIASTSVNAFSLGRVIEGILSRDVPCPESASQRPRRLKPALYGWRYGLAALRFHNSQARAYSLASPMRSRASSAST